MLQLGGTIVCSSTRTTSTRLSWWFTGQNLLSASTAQTIAATDNASLEADNDKKLPAEKKVEYTAASKEKPAPKRNFHQKSLLMATFKSLSISSKTDETHKIVDLKNQLKTAKTLDEVLATTDDPAFDERHAAVVIPVLHNWVSDNKVKLNELENNNKFWKAYNSLNEVQPASGMSKANPYGSIKYNSRNRSGLDVDKIRNYNTYQLITVLLKLATEQSRVIPLLQEITTKISESRDHLNIKHLSDVLYALSVLNYFNNALMDKISNDLIKILPSNTNSSVVGSILKSIGVLHYRHEALLDMISKWIVKYHKTIRPQEINNLLMTLAYLGYTPNNMSELMETVITPLKESDMCDSSEWLDVTWALTILNHTSPVHYESVLNTAFLSRVFDFVEKPKNSVSMSLKVLNINAGAGLLPDYKGPLLPENSHHFSVTLPCSNEKKVLSNCIISALKMLAPSNCFITNINTKMGFFLDAEFCVNEQGTPVPLNTKLNNNKEVLRIAVVTCGYHDFCRGLPGYIGPVKFYNKLLQHQGYKTLMIPYTEVNVKGKLIDRVRYLNDSIKNLVEAKSQ